MILRLTRSQVSKRIRFDSIRRVFRRFGPHLRPHRKKLAAAGLCMLGVTGMELLRPWPIKIIFDGILIPQSDGGSFLADLPALVGGGDVMLALVAVSILVIAVLTGLFGFGQAYLISGVGQRVVAAIRFQLYRHIQSLSHSFHDERSSGDLLARLTGDVRMMRDLLVSAVVFVGGRTLLILSAIVVMLIMDWQLTLVALATIPALALTTVRLGSKIKGAAKRQRRKESKVAQVISEGISAITIVQAYAREAHEEERFARQNNSSVRAGLVATKLEAHLDRVVQIILAFGTCGVLWFGVVRVQTGALTPGDLLVFVAYLTALYKPIRRLAGLTGRVAKATACGERIISILDLEPEVRDQPGARPAPPFWGEITFSQVEFAYHPAKPVLRGADLRINPGETVALVGESGSGKSTIASLLLRFYDPNDGSVRIDGVDVRHYTLSSLREQISIVLQESVLFKGSIADNIAYGRLDATDDEIVAAATQANAHAFIEALPDGYDTMVGERGATLSAGQRQRIAIARAIVRDAPIVILDEATTGLDDASEATVREALEHLTAEKTCLVITHDLQGLIGADRVLAVRAGRIVDVTPDIRRLAELPGRATLAGLVLEAS